MGRRRRPAAETRAEILEAGRALLVEHGPAGVRLDDVAEVVGVSRQAVLHHFGSREELMRAVVQRAWTTLFADLATLDRAPTSLEGFVDQVDDVVRVQGNARLGAWLLLSGTGLPDEVFEGALGALPDLALRALPEGVDRRDVEHGLVLIGAALFGDAVFGGRIRQALGLPDGEEERAAFRAWLVAQLQK